MAKSPALAPPRLTLVMGIATELWFVMLMVREVDVIATGVGANATVVVCAPCSSRKMSGGRDSVRTEIDAWRLVPMPVTVSVANATGETVGRLNRNTIVHV